MKLYFRLFIWVGGPAALLFGTLFGLAIGSFEGLLNGILKGLFCGAIFSLLAVTSHYAITAKYRSKRAVDLGKVVQRKFIELNVNYEKTFDLCVQGLRSIKKCRIISEDKRSGFISAETSRTWRSWGENIEVQIWKFKDNQTRLQVTSQPCATTAKIDWGGKNIENTEKFASYLKTNQ